MNWDRVEGNWKEFKGKVQQRYGVARDEAERQIDTWLKSVN